MFQPVLLAKSDHCEILSLAGGGLAGLSVKPPDSHHQQPNGQGSGYSLDGLEVQVN